MKLVNFATTMYTMSICLVYTKLTLHVHVHVHVTAAVVLVLQSLDKSGGTIYIILKVKHTTVINQILNDCCPITEDSQLQLTTFIQR